MNLAAHRVCVLTFLWPMHALDARVLFFIYRANIAEFQLDLLIDPINDRLEGRFGRDGVRTSKRRGEGNV